MKRPPLIFIVCLASALLVCGLGAWLVGRKHAGLAQGAADLRQADSELNQAVADAKAAGLPWTSADIAQQPPVKDAENAAPFVEKGMAFYKVGLPTETAIVSIAEPFNQGDNAAVGRLLAQLQPVLALARQAADKPCCDFHRNWDEGVALLFPEYAFEKQAARLLSAEAVIEAGRGEATAALRDVARAFATGRHMSADPCIIAMLVTTACDMIALRAVERIAELWHADARRLDMLRNTLGRLGSDPDFAWALRGECYLGIATIRNIVAKRPIAGPGPTPGSPPRRGWWRTGVPGTTETRAFMCRHLQMWLRIHAAIAGKTDQGQIGAAVDEIVGREKGMGPSHRLNEILAGVYAPAGTFLQRLSATRRCTVALIGALEFKAVHGRYASTLSEAGVTDTDPFDGKPLKLRVSGSECRVYSVGPDGTDNGGIRMEELPKGADRDKGWDIVASYPSYRTVAE